MVFIIAAQVDVDKDSFQTLGDNIRSPPPEIKRHQDRANLSCFV